MTFPDDPRTETYQKERKKAVVSIIDSDNTSSESFVTINPS